MISVYFNTELLPQQGKKRCKHFLAWRNLLQLRHWSFPAANTTSGLPWWWLSCKASQKHRPLPLKCGSFWNGDTLKWFLEVFRVMQVYFRTLVSWLISELWYCIFLFLFLITVLVCREVFHNVNVYCNTSCMKHSAEPVLLLKAVSSLGKMWDYEQ